MSLYNWSLCNIMWKLHYFINHAIFSLRFSEENRLITEGHEVYCFLLGASNFLVIIWLLCYKFCLAFEHLYITIPVQANMEPVSWYKSEFRTSILCVLFNKVWATIMSLSLNLCLLSYNHGCSTFLELHYLFRHSHFTYTRKAFCCLRYVCLTLIHKGLPIHQRRLLLYFKIYQHMHQPKPLDIFHHISQCPSTSTSLYLRHQHLKISTSITDSIPQIPKSHLTWFQNMNLDTKVTRQIFMSYFFQFVSHDFLLYTVFM
jgi:hypothetical protein